ncbi:hypothetical protein K3495_g14137 [Podosphaera aphanis]|nr:hypothetical protein K3495_g14137 [Podosphaera aphanis]
MHINDGSAISCSNILLVPYEKRHVPTYHQWMKDEKIRIATASKLLRLEEEYLMQEQWRTHCDKLTFIICIPPSIPRDKVLAGTHDAPEHMVGDVNLFIQRSTENPHTCLGEMELMIAPVSERKKGYGRAATLAFLHYLAIHLEEILKEFEKKDNPKLEGGSELRSLELYVRVDAKNEASIRLFESIGFVALSLIPNVFHEIELKMGESLSLGETTRLLKKYSLDDFYSIIPYVEEGKTDVENLSLEL